MELEKNSSEINESFVDLEYSLKTNTFSQFCERAENQNADFPLNISDRMSIAQHFGVPTPLLDWSQNVLTATFFAIREVFSNSSFKQNFEVYLYHIRDERHLELGIPNNENIALFNKSVRVKPFPIDRRIERQKAVFTYHPHPDLKPKKIPISLYQIRWDIVKNLIDLMKGFGFTEDYYFPDYAGIAHAVTSETTL